VQTRRSLLPSGRWLLKKSASACAYFKNVMFIYDFTLKLIWLVIPVNGYKSPAEFGRNIDYR
jgi:hypothetical protein